MDGSKLSDPAHVMVRYKSDRQKGSHAAVCSCGWESDDMHSAGLAYSVWDAHAERTEDSGS